MTNAEALKSFFGVPGKPVTSKELLSLKRADADGFAELSELAVAALTSPQDTEALAA